MVDEGNKPTIKPITIKPITIKPIKVTPNPTEGAPAASVDANTQATIGAAQGSPTIRLKPPTQSSIPTPQQAAAPSPINLKTPAQAPITSKAPTTSMPRVVSSSDDDDAGKATMRIRPPAPAVTPAIKLDPITPTPSAGDISAQASKGKTSRISLDSAMDNSSASASASPAPVGKLTSHIPDIASSAPKSSTVKITMPAEESVTNTQQVTRKQTLRVKAPARKLATPGAAANAPDSEAKTVVRKPISIKKPTAANPAPADPAADGATPEGGINHIPGIEDENVMAFNTTKPVKVEKVNPVFIVFSALSIVAILVIIFMFLAQCSGPDRSLTQYSSMPNGPDIGFVGKLQIR